MKRILFILLLAISFTTSAGIKSEDVFITDIMMYAKDDNYTAEECIVYVSEPVKSKCGPGSRYVIRTDKAAGEIMCSFALSAFIAGKKVAIGSEDKACSITASAPYARYVHIYK